MKKFVASTVVAFAFYELATPVIVGYTGIKPRSLPAELPTVLFVLAVASLLIAIARQPLTSVVFSLVSVAMLAAAVTASGLNRILVVPAVLAAILGAFDIRYTKTVRILFTIGLLVTLALPPHLQPALFFVAAYLGLCVTDRFLVEGKHIITRATKALGRQRSALTTFFLIYGLLVIGFSLTYRYLDVRADQRAFAFDGATTEPESFFRYLYFSSLTITNCGSGGGRALTTLPRLLVSLESILGVFIVVLYLQHVIDQSNRLKPGPGGQV